MNDPFLGKRLEEGNLSTVPLRDEFLENARLFIFETYCRIHQRIDMKYLHILPSNLLYTNFFIFYFVHYASVYVRRVISCEILYFEG